MLRVINALFIQIHSEHLKNRVKQVANTIKHERLRFYSCVKRLHPPLTTGREQALKHLKAKTNQFK